MAKPHWNVILPHPESGQLEDHGFGCQESSCTQKATWQWQREATPQEVEQEANTEGPYGKVVRSRTGPQKAAVFSCAEHALPLDAMAQSHLSTCPAPDKGCVCHGSG